MSVLICDFMGDSTLVNVAEDLCKRKSDIFSHLISHTLPKKGTNLSKLSFIDATMLYRLENLEKAFPKLTPAPIDYEESLYFKECQELFIAAQDRCCPSPLSSHYNIKFFYDLLGYLKSFLLKNNTIDTIIIDNTPHMPWDICLFYIAKKLNIKILFLRKTGMAGYLYLDEDFRPNLQNWHYKYKTIDNPLEKELSENRDFFSYLQNNSFTKGQIGGSWPSFSKKISSFRNFINFIKKIGLNEVVHFLRIILKKIPNNSIGATFNTKQISIYAGLPKVNLLKHYLLHRKYINRQKKYIKVYQKLSVDYSSIQNKKYIYFPLHLQPERSTLPEGTIFNDQILAIRLLSETMPKDWIIVIKEHPKQHTYDLRGLNSRSSLDYVRLAKIKNTYLVPVKENHTSLIKNCQMTATISGSVSWEGLLECKPSLVFSEVWHHECKSTRYIGLFDNINESINKLSLKTNKEIISDVSSFIKDTAPYYIHGGLNNNHISMFFEGNEKVSRTNIAKALIERISL